MAQGHRARVRSVDALRGFAALGVAVFHTYFQNGGRSLQDTLPGVFDLAAYAGSYGVQVFFVISGFVVAYTLYDNRDMTGPGAVGVYFLRRSVRLDPTYWTAFLLYLAFVPLLLSWTSLGHFDARNYGPVELLENVFYFIPLPEPHDYYLPVTWTLAIEVQFYVFFAGVIVAINRLESRRIDRDAAVIALCAALMAVVLLINAGVVHAPDGFVLAQMKTFLGGILLALAMLGVPHARALLVAHLAMLALSVALFDPPYVLGATVAIVMVIAVTQVKALDRLASAPALVGLGLLSYCIYLFHMLVGGATIEFLQAVVTDEPGWLQPVFLVCGLAATILFSALVYRLVEKPSIALSKRFAPAPRLREATA